ncbi:MAG: class I SAM-dependent methyltransferase [Thermoleophilia bacterium]
MLAGVSEFGAAGSASEAVLGPFVQEAASAAAGALGISRRMGAGDLADVVRSLASDDGPWAEHLDGAATSLRYHDDLARLASADLRGATVVDAGCGDGFNLLVLAVLGAAQVIGIDVDADRLATAKRGAAALPPDYRRRLVPHLGDVAALPVDDASVDLLISNEAVGVYLDVAAFLREAARVVRPGGAVVIAEANTLVNPLLRRRNEDLWEAYERGPAPRTVHGHRIDFPYVEERLDIVRRTLPELDGSAARDFAENTALMTRDQVVAVCRMFAETGIRPARPYRRGEVPVAPAGMVVERPVDPRLLARSLEGLGFRATVHGYWGGAGGRRPVRVANRALSSIGPRLLWAAPSFRIVGRR